MAARRMDRVNALLRERIGEVLVTELSDPRLASVISVIRVVTSSDLRNAKVYVSVLGDDSEKQKSLEALTSASVLCPDAVDTEISMFYTNPKDDEETRQRKIQWLKYMDIELIKPDRVGEQVVNAIRNDELYIFCDGYGSRRLVKRRTKAMLDAFDRQFPE